MPKESLPGGPSLDDLTSGLKAAATEKKRAPIREKIDRHAQTEHLLAALQREFSSPDVDTVVLKGWVDDMAGVLGKKLSEETFASTEGVTVKEAIQAMEEKEQQLEKNMDDLRRLVQGMHEGEALSAEAIDREVERMLADDTNDSAVQVRNARESMEAATTELRTAIREFGLTLVHTLQESTKAKKAMTEQELAEWEKKFAEIEAPPQNYETRIADMREEYMSGATRDVRRKIERIQFALGDAKEEKRKRELESSLEEQKRSLAAQEVLQEQLLDTIQAQIERDISDEALREIAFKQLTAPKFRRRLLQDEKKTVNIVDETGTSKEAVQYPEQHWRPENAKNFGFDPSRVSIIERPNGVSDDVLATIVEQFVRTEILIRAATIHEGGDSSNQSDVASYVGGYDRDTIKDPQKWATFEANVHTTNQGWEDTNSEYIFISGNADGEAVQPAAVTESWGDVLTDAVAVQKFVSPDNRDGVESKYFNDTFGNRQLLSMLESRHYSTEDERRDRDALLQSFSRKYNRDTPRGERAVLTTKDYYAKSQEAVSEAEQTALGVIAERDAAVERAKTAEAQIRQLKNKIEEDERHINDLIERHTAEVERLRDRERRNGNAAGWSLAEEQNRRAAEQKAKEELQTTMQEIQVVAKSASAYPGAFGGNAKKALEQIVTLLDGKQIW